MAHKFARHREQAEAETVAKIVAWLRDGGSWEKPVPSHVEDVYWDAAKPSKGVPNDRPAPTD